MSSSSPRPGGNRRDDSADELLFPPLDGKPGPARRLSSAVSAEMVRSILDAALEAPNEPIPELIRPLQEETPRWRRALAFAAAALIGVSIGGGAGAVAWRFIHVELGDPEPVPDAQASRAHRRRSPPPPPAAAPVAPAEPIVAPAPVVAPPPVEQPVAHVRKRRVHRVAHAAPRPIAPPPEVAPAPVVVPENLPPEDLLASANERRARHAWREADAFYGAVVSRFPASDAAMVAEVASASLHLQHLRDATGALATFRRTLRERPSGTLAEEARWGIAEAHRVLGDARAEADALREFLARHPQSALAPAAQGRLARLSP